MSRDSSEQPALYRSLPGHNDPIVSLCFSSSSKQLASASGDHLLYLWNLQAKNMQAKKLKGHSGAITEVAFSPSGSLIATTRISRRRYSAHHDDHCDRSVAASVATGDGD